MEPLDYLSLQDSYGGKHIAIRNEKVIASADTLGELVREIIEKGLPAEEVVFEYVRPKGMVCVY
jgi:hypothetical protein